MRAPAGWGRPSMWGPRSQQAEAASAQRRWGQTGEMFPKVLTKQVNRGARYLTIRRGTNRYREGENQSEPYNVIKTLPPNLY